MLLSLSSAAQLCYPCSALLALLSSATPAQLGYRCSVLSSATPAQLSYRYSVLSSTLLSSANATQFYQCCSAKRNNAQQS